MGLKMKRYPDQQFLTDLQSPDKRKQDKALKYLYQQYYPIAEKWIVSYHGNLDVKDLFQEAVIILYENVRSGQFKGKSSLKTYLMGIVKNRCKKRLEHKKYESLKEQHPIEEHSWELLEEEQQLERKRTLVMGCLDKLDQRCRELLLGCYFEGLSMKQLAIRLGYANDQVAKSKNYKCMKKLMERVQQQLKEHEKRNINV